MAKQVKKVSKTANALNKSNRDTPLTAEQISALNNISNLAIKAVVPSLDNKTAWKSAIKTKIQVLKSDIKEEEDEVKDQTSNLALMESVIAILKNYKTGLASELRGRCNAAELGYIKADLKSMGKSLERDRASLVVYENLLKAF